MEAEGMGALHVSHMLVLACCLQLVSHVTGTKTKIKHSENIMAA